MRYFYTFPIFLMLYQFSLYMSNDMYTPAFPAISRDFAVNNEMVQLTLSFWLLGGALSQLILGPLSDHYGRRPILFMGGGAFVISCITCAYTSSIELFMFCRFIQGAGVCSMMIAGYSCIHEKYNDKDAVSIISLMTGVSVTAPMIGPLLGGYVVSLYDWRIIFLLIAASSLITVVGLYFVMPKDNVSSESNFDLKGAFKEYTTLILNKEFIRFSMTYGLFYSGLVLWIALSPFILMNEHSLTPEGFGLIQIPVFLAFMIGSLLTKVFVAKFSLQKLITLSIYGGLFSSIILLLGVVLLNSSIICLIIAMSLYAFSFGIVTAPLNRLSFNASSSPKGITASGFYTCMMATGSVITMAFGFLLDNNSSSYAWIMLLITLLIIFLFKRKTSGVNDIV